jgi:hypothetical protein
MARVRTIGSLTDSQGYSISPSGWENLGGTPATQPGLISQLENQLGIGPMPDASTIAAEVVTGFVLIGGVLIAIELLPIMAEIFLITRKRNPRRRARARRS